MSLTGSDKLVACAMVDQRDVEIAPGPTAGTRGRRVVAVIGIDRYRHWRGLTNAVSDATGARALFLQLGFQEVSEPLLDERATRDAITALVTDDLMVLGEDDSLVLFYAGHGGTRAQQLGDRWIKTGYLIPVDAIDAPNRVASWIDLEEWLRRVSRLPPRHILVILDACHSGIALGPIIKWRDIGARGDLPLEALAARRSRRIITSALDDQLARDSGPVHGHSLFTGCLIEGLTDGLAREGHDVATGSEVGLYVQRRVKAFPDSQQTPDFGTFDFDERGEMLIPLLPRPAAAKPAAPALETTAWARRDLPPHDPDAGDPAGTASGPVAEATPPPLAIEATTAPRRDPTPRLVPAERSADPIPAAPRRRSRRLFAAGLAGVATIVAGLALWHDVSRDADAPSPVAPAVQRPSALPTVTVAVRGWFPDLSGPPTLTLGSGDARPVPARGVLGSSDLSIQFVIGVQGTGRFMGNATYDDGPSHRAGAFGAIQDAIERLARTGGSPASRAAVFALGKSATRRFAGSLSEMKASVLATQAAYRDEIIFDLDAGLRAMIAFVAESKFQGRTFMIMISDTSELPPPSLVAIQQQLDAQRIELHHVVHDDGTASAASDGLAGSRVQVVRGWADLLPAVTHISERIHAERGLEFEVPRADWLRATEAELAWRGGSAQIALDGRTELLLP